MEDYVLNLIRFNQELMELNIKYSEEIERLNNIIDELNKEIYILQDIKGVNK